MSARVPSKSKMRVFFIERSSFKLNASFPSCRSRSFLSKIACFKVFPCALSLRPSRKESALQRMRIFLQAGEEGIEPSHGGTRTHCLTAWLLPKVFLVLKYPTESLPFNQEKT